MTLLQNPLTTSTPLSARVSWSPVHDAIIALWWSVVETDHPESFTEQERMTNLVEAAELPQEDLDWSAERHGAVWLFLLPHVDRSGALDLFGLIEHLSAVPREQLADEFHASVKDCAAHCDHPDITDADLAGFKERILSMLSVLDARVGDQLAELSPTLRHDAESTEFLARGTSLKELIEKVTRGVAYTPEAGIKEIVLVPSVLIRPFNLMFRSEGVLYLVYSASDEAMDADEDTPARWMVDLFKALGDEKRLRLLKHLAEGPATLAELTDYVGLAKSTAHHHLRLLRAAGLVRHNVGASKEDSNYELRKDMLPEANAAVSHYLSPGAPS